MTDTMWATNNQKEQVVELGYSSFFSAQMDAWAEPGWSPARVMACSDGTMRLGGLEADRVELAIPLRDCQGHSQPTVGDWVAASVEEGVATVHRILERRTAMVFHPSGPGREPQTIAANVDVLFLVASATDDLDLVRIERELNAVWDAGARPVVLLNKVDLGGSVEAAANQIEALGFGLAVLPVSAASGEGLDEVLSGISPEATVALVGSYGVGKTAITNRLLQTAWANVPCEPQAPTHGAAEPNTLRQLRRLPRGGLLMDTPGTQHPAVVQGYAGLRPGLAGFHPARQSVALGK